ATRAGGRPGGGGRGRRCWRASAGGTGSTGRIGTTGNARILHRQRSVGSRQTAWPLGAAEVVAGFVGQARLNLAVVAGGGRVTISPARVLSGSAAGLRQVAGGDVGRPRRERDAAGWPADAQQKLGIG